jgi:hypothetical protein
MDCAVDCSDLSSLQQRNRTVAKQWGQELDLEHRNFLEHYILCHRRLQQPIQRVTKSSHSSYASEQRILE